MNCNIKDCKENDTHIVNNAIYLCKHHLEVFKRTCETLKRIGINNPENYLINLLTHKNEKPELPKPPPDRTFYENRKI